MAVAIKNAVCAVVLVCRHFSLSELNNGHRIGTIGVKNFDIGVARLAASMAATSDSEKISFRPTEQKD